MVLSDVRQCRPFLCRFMALLASYPSYESISDGKCNVQCTENKTFKYLIRCAQFFLDNQYSRTENDFALKVVVVYDVYAAVFEKH